MYTVRISGKRPAWYRRPTGRIGIMHKERVAYTVLVREAVKTGMVMRCTCTTYRQTLLVGVNNAAERTK